MDEVSSCDGADARAEEGTQGPGGHRAAALLDGHDVGDAAAADGDGHGAGEAHEEAEGHEHGHVLGEGGADGEDGEEDVAVDVERRAAVNLAERGDDERAEGEAEDVDGDDERGRH